MTIPSNFTQQPDPKRAIEIPGDDVALAAQKPLVGDPKTGGDKLVVFDDFESLEVGQERAAIGKTAQLLSTGSANTALLTDAGPVRAGVVVVPDDPVGLVQVYGQFNASYENLSGQYPTLSKEVAGSIPLGQAVNDAALASNSNPTDHKGVIVYEQAVRYYNEYFADDSAGPSLKVRVESYNKGAAEVNRILPHAALLNQRLAALGVLDEDHHPIDPLTPPLPYFPVVTSIALRADGNAQPVRVFNPSDTGVASLGPSGPNDPTRPSIAPTGLTGPSGTTEVTDDLGPTM